MDLQKALDAFMAGGQSERSNYHVTLGKLIAALSAADSKTPVYYIEDGEQRGVGSLESYRGYYSDLSFQPAGTVSTVGDVLTECMSAMGKTFTGYKGGDYVMDDDTPLWISHHGTASGLAIIAVAATSGEVWLVTKHID